MTKKILIATGVYPPESGGPATYTKLLEECLPALGFSVQVLPFRAVRHLPKVVRHVAYFFKLLGLSRKADIVYALDTVSVGLPAALTAMLRGKKFFVRVPGDYAWEQAQQRFGVSDELDTFQHKSYGVRVWVLRAAQRFVVNHARAVVVPSEYMKKIVSMWTNGSKVHRIYTSITLPPPYALPEDRPKGFLIVSFGRRVPWKGFEALERVVAREPQWKLKIFSELPHVQAMGWLKAADVYVNNSTYEGLSHQLVEALSLGTPIVATDAGGNREVVGACGLVVPTKDDEALYKALKEIEMDKVGVAARATQGLVQAKHFNIDTTITQLVELLLKV
jgi:glycosyltransferase involved in cell wall biosynthesis